MFHKKKNKSDLDFAGQKLFVRLKLYRRFLSRYKFDYSLQSSRDTRVISTRFFRVKLAWCLNISRAHSCYGINDIRHIVPDNRHASLSRRLQPARVMNRAMESFHFSLPSKEALYPVLPLMRFT